jgi:hypothetical protein
MKRPHLVVLFVVVCGVTAIALCFPRPDARAQVPYPKEGSKQAQPGSGSTKAEGGGAKQKWEYKVLEFTPDAKTEEALNKLGDEGWELVSLTYYPSNNRDHVLWVLKRPR